MQNWTKQGNGCSPTWTPCAVKLLAVAILFDTGALEQLRRGDRNAEALALRFYPPLICTHVAAEFLYGLVWAGISAEALLEVREFIESFELLSPKLSTASIYARLRAGLRRSGKQLPDPDYWIAAHAVEHGLPLATIDKHFKEIPELNVHFLNA